MPRCSGAESRIARTKLPEQNWVTPDLIIVVSNGNRGAASKAGRRSLPVAVDLLHDDLVKQTNESLAAQLLTGLVNMSFRTRQLADRVAKLLGQLRPRLSPSWERHRRSCADDRGPKLLILGSCPSMRCHIPDLLEFLLDGVHARDF